MLNYFIGKCCTILTDYIPTQYNLSQFTQYFVGFVDLVDEKGIWISHPMTKCKSYFALQHIVGIIEEQTLDPKIPEQAKLINEIKKKPEVLKESNSNYIDIEQLQKLVKGK